MGMLPVAEFFWGTAKSLGGVPESFRELNGMP